jgi:peptidyl-tRNA hydrolase, PTH1 family
MAVLVVGLGNPGPEYAETRHNIGQAVVEELARRAGAKLKSHKGVARAANVTYSSTGGQSGRETVVLAVPTSYMNVSGGPVAALARYHHVDPADVVVAHDDIDLPFGTIRLKRGGGEGGHNGLKDVSRALKTPDYIRVRFGVGRPPGRMEPADFVLRSFTAAERKEVALLVDTAADAVEAIIVDGLEAAQQRFHTAG